MAIIIGFGTFKTLIVVIWTGRGSVYNRYTEYITSYVALGRAAFFFTWGLHIAVAAFGIRPSGHRGGLLEPRVLEQVLGAAPPAGRFVEAHFEELAQAGQAGVGRQRRRRVVHDGAEELKVRVGLGVRVGAAPSKTVGFLIIRRDMI